MVELGDGLGPALNERVHRLDRRIAEAEYERLFAEAEHADLLPQVEAAAW